MPPRESPPPSTSCILVEGARTHNLKGISVRVPHGALTVITGVSGSGKSSLAFDTLYAEGQRRYVESMSTYARQFLERMARPDVDALSGVPPAIAVEQRNGVRNARSTVATATEIADYLRLLFARIGEVSCPDCGGRVARDSASQAAARLLSAHEGKRAQVIARVPAGHDAGQKLAALAKAGWSRLLLDGKPAEGTALDPDVLRALRVLPVLVDRLAIRREEQARLGAALESAFGLGEGRAEVLVEGAPDPVRLDEGYRCAGCGRDLEPPDPHLFSYNSPRGACPACQGFGRLIGIDWNKVIPDGRKSLRGGAIAPFQTPSNRECQEDLERHARRLKVRLDIPWQELTRGEQAMVLDGEGDEAWRKGRWYGVRGFFRWLESKKYKMHVRVLLARYRGYDACGACKGSRLRPEARAVTIDGRSIADLEALPVAALRQFFAALHLTRQARATAAPLLAEIDARLGYLEEVGLGYLTLGRQTRTLSGGEAQRIALASALGARLTGTLYVLDEPSVGLHPRDSARLLAVLGKLTARGNTVVIVEHDPEIIAAADHVIDLGPGAGAAGGEVVFEGTFAVLQRDRRSATAALYRGRSTLAPLRAAEPAARYRSAAAPPPLRIVNARAHNLKGVTVEIPRGRLTCVTGVSGSGKSTLVEDVLHAAFLRARGRPVDFEGECDAVLGLESLEDAVLVDQTPLARSSRSNPATWLKAFDELRTLLSHTVEAKKLGLSASAFSFNVPHERGGGRCEACAGQGTVTLEMHFLADVTLPCEACGGRRFTEKVLGVRLGGRNVAELLDLTVDEALATFAVEKKIVARLRPLADVGLGYLRLGQSTATLSGGESQRLKLAAHLAPGAGGGEKLFLLDEPTTGLHAADVEVLLAALGRLRAAGHTLVVVEHNLDFIRRADHLIDLGPEGGEAGGQVVATGAPAEVACVAASHTGRALAAIARGARDRVAP